MYTVSHRQSTVYTMVAPTVYTGSPQPLPGSLISLQGVRSCCSLAGPRVVVTVIAAGRTSGEELVLLGEGGKQRQGVSMCSKEPRGADNRRRCGGAQLWRASCALPPAWGASCVTFANLLQASSLLLLFSFSCQMILHL